MPFKEFKSFTKDATTRCGIPFEIESVQKNFDGIITAVKGHILLTDQEGKSIPQEMLWNLKGQAMLIGEQFDLVKEALIEEAEDEDATLPEVAA